MSPHMFQLLREKRDETNLIIMRSLGGTLVNNHYNLVSTVREMLHQ